MRNNWLPHPCHVLCLLSDSVVDAGGGRECVGLRSVSEVCILAHVYNTTF